MFYEFSQFDFVITAFDRDWLWFWLNQFHDIMVFGAIRLGDPRTNTSSSGPVKCPDSVIEGKVTETESVRINILILRRVAHSQDLKFQIN